MLSLAVIKGGTMRKGIKQLIYPVGEAVDGTAADMVSLTIPYKMTIYKFETYVTTTVVGTSTAPVLSLDYTPSGGARAEKATITIPTSTAAGATVASANLTPFSVNGGDAIHFEHKTQAAGSPAGVAYYVIWYR
jgi:hypothetical protein